jgi:signal transduction histidine kinase
MKESIIIGLTVNVAVLFAFVMVYEKLRFKRKPSVSLDDQPELTERNEEIVLLNEKNKQLVEKLRLINVALTEAKEKVEEKDILKYAFLVNMSHQIWTPLNSIIGFADLLRENERNDDDSTKYIGIIKNSAVCMLNIINDLIDVAKVETGQMEVLSSTFNINEQIEFIYSFFKPQVEEKGMKLSFYNSLPSNEAFIKTDHGKIHEIMVKLIYYAIKYSEKGTVDFGYKFNGDVKPAELEFYVKISGSDIPKNIREAVFHCCEKDDIVDKSDVLAAGLGFALSKAYVEMLGSNIQVKSEEDKGLTFYFTLPCNNEPENKNIISSQKKVSKNNDLQTLITRDDEMSELLRSIAIKILVKSV